MKTKKCTVEPPPPPPPPDPCKEQRIRQKIKAGVKICPVKPVIVEPPPAPPSCHRLPACLCIEKIKNLPAKVVTNQPVVCTVEREQTGQARCDKIRDLKAAHPDLPWPGCEPPPPLPPPPEPNLCELQQKRAKLEECKERMKRYRL
ncbi:uncharacterized protein [Maniola hyperantus]|uniref:uncharacterized protein n=1 Tax=Aphantopus hyperantus TaxID=2795564 RepID=UPI0015680F70|nr:synaptic defective enhancer 1-like isoform X2 [Maniola hyperantus]